MKKGKPSRYDKSDRNAKGRAGTAAIAKRGVKKGRRGCGCGGRKR